MATDELSASGGQVESVEDFGKGVEAEARRWLSEIKLARKREESWRNEAGNVWNKYRQKTQRNDNYFNILWSNTEVLRPCIYNSMPSPDVRRRFRDEDPVGKCVSETLKRCLNYSMGIEDFEEMLKKDVLDMLIPGRGVSRIRYAPHIVEDQIKWEDAPIEHVQWDKFLMGAGEVWEEISWIGFVHKLNRKELIDLCGEDLAKKVPLSDCHSSVSDVVKNDDDLELFKTAEVVEIWDKENRQVIFVATNYKDRVLKKVEDPLHLSEFFCTPKPLYMIEDSSSLEPKTFFGYYKKQAQELDEISKRITLLTKGLRFRGIYDSTIKELSELQKSDDNALIPSEGVTALIQMGGLENAIWFLPIDMAAAVLKQLYEQREACKIVIYELTGISDILRASTDANETYGAQRLKSQWGTQRLQRMQKDVQRYIRDLIRIKAEVICNKFQLNTIIQMTQLDYPTQDQVEAAQMMLRAQQSSGTQPDEKLSETANAVSWQEIDAVLRNQILRSYQIDIETDSTITASVDADMEGLYATMKSIVELINGLGPAVQMGALPIDALKQLLLTICRYSKMGSAVEDEIEKIQQPPPPPDESKVEMAKLEAQTKMHEQELQQQGQFEQFKAELEAKIETHRQTAQAQQNQHQNELEAQRATIEYQYQTQMERERMSNDARIAQIDSQIKLLIAQLNNQAKIETAHIQRESALESAHLNAEAKAEALETKKENENAAL